MEREHESEFDEFFASTYPAIVRTTTLVVGDREVARELAQDAFVKALVDWKRVRTYDHPAAWVRTVAFRMALRAKDREPERGAQPERAASQEPPDLDLLDAVGQLPRMQRAAIALHYLDDVPVAQVAETLGCSESTARVHLHRGRHRLAELLSEEHDDAAH